MRFHPHLAVRRSCFWAGLVFALLAAPALHAQVAGSLDPTFNPEATGDYVIATAVQPDGKIVIGGVFTSVNGQLRNRIARLNADGTLESTATFNPGTGVGSFSVGSVAVQADGKIVISGSFVSVDGQLRGNIARLNADGSVESTAAFNPGTGANDSVNCVALQADGKILLGGFFTSVNGQPRGNIARLNADGTLESTNSFNPGAGANLVVNSVAVQSDGKILLGGVFTSVNGQPRNNIARLNANGTLESTATFNPGTGTSGGYANFGTVHSVAVQPDGKILLGGSFDSLDGQPRSNIARLSADGTLESTETFNAGPNPIIGADGVLSLALQADGKILLGGNFTTGNDRPLNSIARLNADGTVESTATFDTGSGPNNQVFGVALQADGKILVGGPFTSVNGQPHNFLARLANDAATQTLTIVNAQKVRWLRGGAAPEVEQVIFERSTDGGANWSLLGTGTRTYGVWECTGLSLVAGGTVRARGRTVGGNANGSSGLVEQIVPLEFVPEIAVELPLDLGITNGSSQSFGAASVNGNTSLTLFIRNLGNVFLTEVGIAIDGPDAAMFTLTTEPAAFVEPLGGSTSFMVKFSPTNIGDKTATLHIASNDADETPFDLILTAHAQNAPVAGSVDPAFAPDVTGSYILAAAVQPDGRILLGGGFTSVESEPRNGIARLHPNGSVESTNTFHPGPGEVGGFSCVVVQADGKILIGGRARLLANGSVEGMDTFNPGSGPNGQVIGMAMQADGKILLAGNFTSVDGQPRGNIARLNSDGSVESTTTFNPGAGANSYITCVAEQVDGKIVIGGDFTNVDGQPRHGIARLHPDGSLESTNTFNPGTGTGGDNPAVFSVAVQVDGKILFGGYFTSVNGEPRHRIARLNVDGTLESTATFNPGTGADDTVNSVALQADGKILLAGYFSTMNGQPRHGIARLHSDGTVESTATFNPGTGVEYNLGGATLQADGKMIVVGNIISVDGHPRTHVARLANDPAILSLAVSNRTRIEWLRGGAAPEVEQVTFEVSTDGGVNWIPAGVGTRIVGGWECTGLNLPLSGSIRARGRTVGATFSGSSGLVEQIAAINPSARAIKEGVLAELIALRAAVTNRTNGRKLDLAIKHLTRSLTANLWVDETHLDRQRGPRAFHEAKLTAWILCHRIKNTKSQLSDTVLQGFVGRIFQAERLLAAVVIDDAVSAGASSKRIGQSQRHLATGDAKSAGEKCYRGIHDYSLAWRRAARAKVFPRAH